MKFDTPRFTPETLALVETIMREHRAAGKQMVRWKDYVGEIGHPLDDLYLMSNIIRSRQRTQARKIVAARHREMNKKRLGEQRAIMRAIFDAAPPAGVTSPKRGNGNGALNQPKFMPRAGLDHTICTSTAKLRSGYDDDDRIAGIFGGPPLGRSALDKKLGIPDPTAGLPKPHRPRMMKRHHEKAAT